MKLQITTETGATETLSSRDAGYLKRGGWITGGKGGRYAIADTVPNGWAGVCNILSKRG